MVLINRTIISLPGNCSDAQAQRRGGRSPEAARAKYPQLKVEVEADTLEQVEQGAAAGTDFVLLDNMTLVQLRLSVQKCKGRSKTEASGGVNLSG